MHAGTHPIREHRVQVKIVRCRRGELEVEVLQDLCCAAKCSHH